MAALGNVLPFVPVVQVPLGPRPKQTDANQLDDDGRSQRDRLQSFPNRRRAMRVRRRTAVSGTACTRLDRLYAPSHATDWLEVLHVHRATDVKSYVTKSTTLFKSIV